MNLDKPTQAEFDAAQISLQQMIQSYSDNIDTRKASVIRQLVVRPIAYIFAQIKKYFDNRLQQTSISQLLLSNKTENQVADMVASNYFVTRMQGSHAAGTVAARCSTASIRVPQGVTFVIDGYQFSSPKTVISSTQSRDDTEYVNYVRSVYVDNSWVCIIPVQAKAAGSLQIPSGVSVQTTSYVAGVTSLQLASPITGGKDTQTDSQMMQRCIKKCGAAVGTQNAIWTRLQEAPVTVLSCKALGSNAAGCFRARQNNLDIPMAGVVDVYVKTQKQASIKQLYYTLDGQDTLLIQSTDETAGVAGFIRVISVAVSQQNTPQYTVTYIDQSKRLSSKQAAQIKFSTSVTGDIVVTVAYMPGIYEVQQYIDSADIAFLGQDTLVKAAVPATVKVHCSVQSTQAVDSQTLTQMKKSVAQFINQKQVGDYVLNMDDISALFAQAYPYATLKLPYSIQVILPMTNGSLYTFNTNSGQVDLNYRVTSYTWDTAAYFFSTTDDYIDIILL